MFRGEGTAINVVAIVLGSGVGVSVGHRLRERTQTVVMDAIGLVTLLIAALGAMGVQAEAFGAAVGSGAPVLIVLGAVLIGGLAGSAADIERRLESLGGWLQDRLTRSGAAADRKRFVEGFVAASLVFCVGPLAILGSINDGLGRGSEQLILKSALDGFVAIAFAASLGIGVMASALAVLVVQASLTLLGALLGSFLPEPHLVAVTATGGVLLAGIGLRLLQVKAVPVADLLPALLVAPVLTQVVASLR